MDREYRNGRKAAAYGTDAFSWPGYFWPGSKELG